MLSRSAKTRILENFYAIDFALFGKSISEMELCCPILSEEYLSVKGALLSTLVEMYELIEHDPVCKTIVDSSMLRESAIVVAKESRGYAKKLVASPMGRKSVKGLLKEEMKVNKSINIDEAIQNSIRKKAFSLAIDSMLIGRAVTESVNPEALNSWEGGILEKTYKVLRTQLVETAYEILDNGILK